MSGQEMKSSADSLLRSGFASELYAFSKVWRDMEYDLGFPLVHLIAKSGLRPCERRNPVTV